MSAPTCRHCGIRIRSCDCGASRKPHWVGDAFGLGYGMRWCAGAATTHEPAPSPTPGRQP